MPITVNDIMQNNYFSKSMILTDLKNGRNRIAGAIYVSDLRKIKSLKAGMLTVIDTIESISYGEFSNFIHMAETADVPCIFILNGACDRLPEWLPSCVNSLDIAVVTIETDLPGRDVVSDIKSYMLDFTVKFWDYVENMKRRFSLLNSSDVTLQSLLELFSEFVKRDVAYVDILTDERCVPSCNNHFFSDSVEKEAVGELVDMFDGEAVTKDGVTVGYILFAPSKDYVNDTYQEIAVEQVKTSMLFCIQKEYSKRETETRYRNEFVEDLLSHNIRMEKEVWTRARIFQWDLRGGQVVLVFDIDNYKRQLTLSIEAGRGNTKLESVKTIIYSVVEKHMKTVGDVTYPCALLSDSIVFILPAIFGREGSEEYRRLDDIIRVIMNECKGKTGFSLTVGIGDVCKSVFESYISYGQAKQGLELLRSDTGGDVVARWSDMGLYKLLSCIKDGPDTKKFVCDVLGPLLARNDDGVLYNTLLEIIEHTWNLRQTAESMGVHYNTMQYRYSRLGEILPVELDNSKDRLKLMLAIELYKMYPAVEFTSELKL